MASERTKRVARGALRRFGFPPLPFPLPLPFPDALARVRLARLAASCLTGRTGLEVVHHAAQHPHGGALRRFGFPPLPFPLPLPFPDALARVRLAGLAASCLTGRAGLELLHHGAQHADGGESLLSAGQVLGTSGREGAGAGDQNPGRRHAPQLVPRKLAVVRLQRPVHQRLDPAVDDLPKHSLVGFASFALHRLPAPPHAAPPPKAHLGNAPNRCLAPATAGQPPALALRGSPPPPHLTPTRGSEYGREYQSTVPPSIRVRS